MSGKNIDPEMSKGKHVHDKLDIGEQIEGLVDDKLKKGA
jgi:hypothetical protein